MTTRSRRVAGDRVLVVTHSTYGHIEPVRRFVESIAGSRQVDVVVSSHYQTRFESLPGVDTVPLPSEPFLKASPEIKNAKESVSFEEVVLYFSRLTVDLVDWLTDVVQGGDYDTIIVDSRASFALPLRTLWPDKMFLTFSATFSLSAESYGDYRDRGLLPPSMLAERCSAEVHAEYRQRMKSHELLRNHFAQPHRLLFDIDADGEIVTHPSYLQPVDGLSLFEPTRTDLDPPGESPRIPSDAVPARGTPTDLVYVSLGTVFNSADNAAALSKLFRTLTGEGYRVVLGCGGNKALYEASTAMNLARVQIELFAKQKEVLRDARFFICHGGMNSVIESLAVATPLLCVPQGDDQFLVANRVVNAGVGVHVDDLDSAIESDYLRPDFPWTTIRRRIEELNVAEKHQGFDAWYEQVRTAKRRTSRSERSTVASAVSIHGAFEAQVEATPNAIAVSVDAGPSLTYQELNEKANELAATIRSSYAENGQSEMPPGTLVCLYFDRGVEMIVAIMAVLKAGGAYVPVDPTYPAERFRTILDQTGARIVLTNRSLDDSVSTASSGHDQLAVLDVDLERLEGMGNLALNQDGTNLAYVIFTSGTTGSPKGVMVTHRNVLSLVDAHWERFGTRDCQVGLLYAPLVFDASVFELFPGLLAGQRLCVCTEDIRQDIRQLEDLIQNQRVEFATLPPSLLETAEPASFRTLRTLVVAGEAPSKNVLRSLYELTNLYNGYGPTETTVCATAHLVSDPEDNTNIGLALKNAQLQILDANQQPVDDDAVGELYVAGAGLAAGYLNRPEETARLFVELPVGDRGVLRRFYRTGDLVAQRENGEILFHGRADNQANIRGHRVEIGEVEAVIGGLELVAQGVVKTVDVVGSDVLVAYVTPASPVRFSKAELLDALQKKLPSYMLPHDVICVESIPLTVNGKVDRDALPKPEFVSSQSYRPPSTELESQLQSAWQSALGRFSIGVDDKFFELGGTSAGANRAAWFMSSHFGRRMSIAPILEYQTIALVASHLERDGFLDAVPSGEKRERCSSALSIGQQGILIADRLNPNRTDYNLSRLYRVVDNADISKVKEAIVAVSARHAMLSSVIETDSSGDLRMRRLARPLEVETRVVDTLLDVDRQSKLFAAEPFDLQAKPGTRALLCQLGETYYLSLAWHHMVFDGRSLRIFLRDLGEWYRETTSVKKDPAEKVDFFDYVIWQNGLLSTDRRRELVDFWKNELDDPSALLHKPSEPKKEAHTMQAHYFDLDPVRGSLQLIPERLGVSQFSALLAALFISLHRHFDHDDLVVDTPFDGRIHPDFADVVGYFVTTLPLRSRLDRSNSVREFVGEVQRRLAAAARHQDVPPVALLSKSSAHTALGTDLLSVLFVSQHFGIDDQIRDTVPLVEAQSALPAPENIPSIHDITIQVDASGKPRGAILFKPSVIDGSQIVELAETFTQTVETMVADPDQPVGAFMSRRLLAPSASRDAGRQESTESLTLLSLVERAAAEDPDALAVICNGRKLRYRELIEQVNAFANQLRDAYQSRHGEAFPNGTLVGLFVDRSVEMVVSMLGICKAGGAYVPLDVDSPDARIRYFVADASLSYIVTSASTTSRLRTALADQASYGNPVAGLPQGDVEILEVTDLLADSSSDRDHRREPKIGATDLAYVIYTSGTTGSPKGVMVEHGSVVQMVEAHIKRLRTKRFSKSLQACSIVFDGSVYELFVGLASGHCVTVATEDQRRDPVLLTKLINEQAIEQVGFTPAVLSLLDETRLPTVELVVVAGERPTQELLDRFSSVAEIHNVYGPTEATVAASANEYQPGDSASNIGQPFAGSLMYVLDDDHRPVIEREGELYIGGVGVARGYLNKVDLTERSFLPDPFASPSEADPSLRMYKTGDRVRRLASGDIEYVGRVDSQVKIGGIRVELGEVGSAMERIPEVAQAAVTTRSSSSTLVAYVVPKSDHALEVSDVLNQTRSLLPSHMVPGTVIEVSELPKTANGKIDVNALKDRSVLAGSVRPSPSQATTDAAPSSESSVERARELLVDLWATTLDIDADVVSDSTVETNFFDMGGTSLTLIKFQNLLNKHLTDEVPLLEIYENPSVAALAPVVAPLLNEPADGAGPKDRAGPSGPIPTPTTGPGREIAEPSKNEISDHDVAIVGMALRLPGAENVEEFWANLAGGVESVAQLSDEALQSHGVSRQLRDDPRYVKAHGCLDGIDHFAAQFFGVTRRDAEAMDPQQRVFMECSWEALEDAGLAHSASEIGVFGGVGTNGYFTNHILPNAAKNMDRFSMVLNNERDFLTTRVSYHLDLTGPSVNVQTACSTSLVAVHLAIQGLRSGSFDAALAGGCSLQIPHEVGYLYEQGLVHSPDGTCRAFDQNANGTVGGSGAAIVALKLLDKALLDGDQIHAVIKGSAINNDGKRKVGFTAPSVDRQADVLQKAYADAKISPASVSYIETHGTGTDIGDQIEIAALRSVFGNPDDRSENQSDNQSATPIFLGTLKPNIGHTDTAAGVAGLIKAALVVKHRQVPPCLHFESPNEALKLESSPFSLGRELQALGTSDQVLHAGVSAFGIGGTNAHVVLQQPPSRTSTPSSREDHLLVVSAATDVELGRRCADLADYVGREPRSDETLAQTAAVLQRRTSLEFRTSVVASSVDEIVEQLRSRVGAANESVSAHAGSSPAAPIFLFAGQGTYQGDMGWELYNSEPAFREAFDACNQILVTNHQVDLHQTLWGSAPHGGPTPELTETRVAQPALFVVEYALVQLWGAYGVTPGSMIGHSLGEFVAACIAGVFSLDDALALVVARGEVMQRAPAGSMLVVSSSAESVAAHLQGDVGLAAINGPESVVLTGPSNALSALVVEFGRANVDCSLLPVKHAFHSTLMDTASQEFASAVAQVDRQRPRIPFASNVTGTWIRDEEAIDPQYWARHIRRTVMFLAGMEVLAASGSLAIEIGPGNSVAPLAARCSPRLSVVGSMPSTFEKKSGDAVFLEAVGSLWRRGAEISWGKYEETRRHLDSSLPTYPWHRERYWIDNAAHPPRQIIEEPGSQRWAAMKATAATYSSVRMSLDELTISREVLVHDYIDRLCVSLVYSAFDELGLVGSDKGGHRRIDPRYEHFVNYWTTLFVDQGVVKQNHGADQEGGRSLVAVRPPEVPDWPLPGPSTGDPTSVSSLAAVVEQVGGQLVDILIGDTEPRELLYPDSLASKDDNAYDDRYVQRFFGGMIGSVVAQYRDHDEGEGLQILEVGGGQGMTTRTILPILSAHAETYVFSDVSQYFLNEASELFEEYDNVEYERYDFNLDPGSQGFSGREFDLIVATLSLHVADDLSETLANLRSMVAPGGVLLLWELIEPLSSFAMIEGTLMPEIRDGERTPCAPGVTTERWKSLLTQNGFSEVLAFPESGLFGHQFFMVSADEGSPTEPGTQTDLLDETPNRAVRAPGKTKEAVALERQATAADVDVDDTGHVVAAIWSDLVGSKVAINDDFFAIGGDSLLATRAVGRINTQFGVDLSVGAFLEGRTVADVAAHVDRLRSDSFEEDSLGGSGRSIAAESNIVLLHQGHPGAKTLFIIHAIGGEVFAYRELAQAFNDDFSVYGIRSDSGDPPDSSGSIERMAQHYVRAIRAVQPSGPYHLAGASFGGVVAFECAQQLERSNVEVASLLLVDTPSTDPDSAPAGWPDPAHGVLAHMVAKNYGVDVTSEMVSGLVDEVLVANCVAALVRSQTDLEADQLSEELSSYVTNSRVMTAYRPARYTSSPVHFFRAKERDDHLPHYPERFWQGFVDHDFTVIQSNGDHSSMLSGVNAGSMAARMEAVLRRGDGRPMSTR